MYVIRGTCGRCGQDEFVERRGIINPAGNSAGWWSNFSLFRFSINLELCCSASTDQETCQGRKHVHMTNI